MFLKTHYTPSWKLQTFYTGGPLAYSLSEEIFACAHEDQVKVVTAAAGELLQTLRSDGTLLTALVFDDRSAALYGASRGLQLFAWDAVLGSCTRAWKVSLLLQGHSSPVACLALDASGGLLAAGSADRSLRVWDTHGYFCTHVFRGHSAPVQQVVFQASELVLVSGAEDGEIRAWDLVRQTCLTTMSGHVAAITSLTICAGGWTLLSASRDKTVAFWDLGTFVRQKLIPVFASAEGAVALDWTRSGRQKGIRKSETDPTCFATAGQDGAVKVWNSSSGACLETCEVPGTTAADRQLKCLIKLRDGGLMMATADARLVCMSPQTGSDSEAQAKLQLTVKREIVGDHGEITDLRFLGPLDAPTHLLVANNSATLRIYDVADGSCQTVLRGHTDIVLALDAAPAAEPQALVVSGGKDNTFVLWNVMQQQAQREASVIATQLASAKGHTTSVTAVAIAQQASSTLVLSASSDGMLKAWPIDTAKLGATGEGNSLQSTATVAAHDKDINGIAVSLKGALACTASHDRTAKVWKLPSLVLLLTLRGHKKGVWAAAFSPVEQTIATASGDRTIKLWALKSGACLKTFQGHTAAVLRVLFISSGLQVASSSADGLLKLWNVATSECSATLDAHEDRIWALAGSSASGELLASGGSDGLVCLWKDASQAQIDEGMAVKSAAVAAEQAFSNAMQAGDKEAALSLAWTSKHPQQLRKVVESLQAADADEATMMLAKLVQPFSEDQLKQAFIILRDWNTTAQHCEQAQAMLSAIFRTHPPKVLRTLTGLGDLLSALAPYSERHIANVDRLLTSCNVLDYTLMRLQHVESRQDDRLA